MIEVIKSRRSCKKFLSRHVDEHDIKEIVECGLMAPNARNKQAIQFCVITNKEILKEMIQLSGKNFIYGAPVLIVVYADKDVKSVSCDGACAISQMYLAAHSLGLGGCWINHLKNYVDDPLFAGLFERLGVKNKTIVGAFALGYAASDPIPKIVNYNRVQYIK